MNMGNRLNKLEHQAETTGAVKGTVAPWALEYVRKGQARLVDGRTGEIMRALIGDPDPDGSEGRIMRRAQYLTETYPNPEACQRGEALCPRSQEIYDKLVSGEEVAGLSFGISSGRC
jgi:hypothetical protein